MARRRRCLRAKTNLISSKKRAAGWPIAGRYIADALATRRLPRSAGLLPRSALRAAARRPAQPPGGGRTAPTGPDSPIRTTPTPGPWARRHARRRSPRPPRRWCPRMGLPRCWSPPSGSTDRRALADADGAGRGRRPLDRGPRPGARGHGTHHRGRGRAGRVPAGDRRGGACHGRRHRGRSPSAWRGWCSLRTPGRPRRWTSATWPAAATSSARPPSTARSTGASSPERCAPSTRPSRRDSAPGSDGMRDRLVEDALTGCARHAPVRLATARHDPSLHERHPGPLLDAGSLTACPASGGGPGGPGRGATAGARSRPTTAAPSSGPRPRPGRPRSSSRTPGALRGPARASPGGGRPGR